MLLDNYIKFHQTEEGIQLIIIWYDGKWVYKYTIWMGFGWRWEENIYEYHYYVILLFIICIGLEQVSCQSLYQFWIALSYHINTPLYFAYLFFAGLQLKILDSINEWLRSINFSFIFIICTSVIAPHLYLLHRSFFSNGEGYNFRLTKYISFIYHISQIEKS